MIIVHHLNNSRSQRILWLLEELGVPYEVQRYERDTQTLLAPPALRTIHPLGKSPVITDGATTVAESGAIVEYLIDRYGAGPDGASRLIPPPGTPQRLRYTYWLHYAEGSAMPPLLLKLIFDRVAATPTWPVSVFARGIAAKVQSSFIAPQLKLHLDFMESEVARDGWFAGPEFTAADIQMSFPIEAAAARAGLNASRPYLLAYLARVRARDAYQRALTRGGRYDY